jgi:hypothetical protein
MLEKSEVSLKVERKWVQETLNKKELIIKLIRLSFSADAGQKLNFLMSKIVRYVVQSYFKIQYDIR